MNPSPNRKGYYQVAMSENKNNKFPLLQRLVAIAFIPNPDNKPDVNHRFGDKSDNRASMLEWNTRAENIQHAFDTGLKISVKGSNHGRSKLLEKDVLDIVLLDNSMSKREIAKRYNIGEAAIGKILNGDRWSHITGIKKADK